MNRAEAIEKIRECCHGIAGGVTRIHPLVPGLADAGTQAEVIKALFELTKQVEVVKKQLARLEKRDESSLV